MCSVSLPPEVCYSIGEVEVPMLNVALNRVRAPKIISGCRQYDNGLRWARIFRLNRRLKILGSGLCFCLSKRYFCRDSGKKWL